MLFMISYKLNLECQNDLDGSLKVINASVSHSIKHVQLPVSALK